VQHHPSRVEIDLCIGDGQGVAVGREIDPLERAAELDRFEHRLRHQVVSLEGSPRRGNVNAVAFRVVNHVHAVWNGDERVLDRTSSGLRPRNCTNAGTARTARTARRSTHSAGSAGVVRASHASSGGTSLASSERLTRARASRARGAFIAQRETGSPAADDE